LTIAQQFIAGDKAGNKTLSPVGTTEERFASVQSSLRDSIFIFAAIPSTEVLGYYQLPLTGLENLLTGQFNWLAPALLPFYFYLLPFG
jgi:hypothetical protein